MKTVFVLAITHFVMYIVNHFKDRFCLLEGIRCHHKQVRALKHRHSKTLSLFIIVDQPEFFRPTV